ncbi:MAG: hypothetical protein K2X87_01725, partial [Gemmataceae bacterium]|nr:hypothetical protein [Gemmataceae bacterium]
DVFASPDWAPLGRLTGFTRGTLTAYGDGSASLPFTTLTDADVRASNGAVVTVPNLVSVTAAGRYLEFQAESADSRLELPALTTLSTQAYYSVKLRAVGGGVVAADALAAVSGGQVYLEAINAGSRLDLPALAAFAPATGHIYSYSGGRVGANAGLTALDGVTVFAGPDAPLLANLTSFKNATLTVYGAGAVDLAVDTLDRAEVVADNGAVARLPDLTAVAVSDRQVSLQASGAGSRLELPALTSFAGGVNYFAVLRATGGGVVSAPGLAAADTGLIAVEAIQADSRVELPGLTTFASVGGRIYAYNGGRVAFAAALTRLDRVTVYADAAWPALAALTAFTDADLTLIGKSTVTLANLSDLTAASVTADGGAAVTLSGVTAYTGKANRTTTLQASGDDSRLELPNLAALVPSDNGTTVLRGTYGGVLVASGLTSITAGSVGLAAYGADGRLEVPNLATFTPAGGYLYSYSGGAVVLPAAPVRLSAISVYVNPDWAPLARLATLADVDMTVTGAGAATLAALTDATGSTIRAEGGADLSLPGLTGFHASSTRSAELRAGGAASRIDLPNLTAAGGTGFRSVTLNANSGGRLTAPKLAAVAGGYASVYAYGTDGGVPGRVELPALATFAPSESGDLYA